MKKLLTIVMVMAITMFATQAFAQGAKDVKAKKYSSSSSKFTLPTEDKVAPKRDLSRGDCCLNFDNYTGYTIYVWVDGNYQGTVAGWRDGGVCVGEGYTTWYARTAGSTYEWSGEGGCYGDYNLRIE